MARLPGLWLDALKDAAPAMPMVDAASPKHAASRAKRILGFEFTGEYYRPKREMRL
jgi:hypothetical protein